MSHSLSSISQPSVLAHGNVMTHGQDFPKIHSQVDFLDTVLRWNIEKNVILVLILKYDFKISSGMSS